MNVRLFLITLKLWIKRNWYPIILIIFIYHLIMIVFYNASYFSSISGFIGVIIGGFITFQFSIYKDKRQIFEHNKVYALNKIIPLIIECEVFLLSQKTVCLNSENIMQSDWEEDRHGYEDATRKDRIEQAISGDKKLYSFVKDDFLLTILEVKYFCELHFNMEINNEINNIETKVIDFIKNRVVYIDQGFYDNIYVDIKQIYDLILQIKKSLKYLNYYKNVMVE